MNFASVVKKMSRTMRHLIGTALVVCSLMILGVVAFRDELAMIAWRKYKLSSVTLQLNQNSAVLSTMIGEYYFNGVAYDLARAKRGYEQAVKIDPKIRLGHYQLARIYFVEGKFREALDEINKELELYPENLRSLYIRGLIEGYAGELKAADDDFKKFIAWSPGEWAGYNDRAWILAKRENYEEMKEVAQSGIEQAVGGRSNPWLWNMLGVAELNLKQHTSAGKAFIEAKKLAEALTDAQWRQAYPGNDPSGSGGGRAAFTRAIADNLIKTKWSVDKRF